MQTTLRSTMIAGVRKIKSLVGSSAVSGRRGTVSHAEGLAKDVMGRPLSQADQVLKVEFDPFDQAREQFKGIQGEGSLARWKLHPEVEKAVNDQINVEFSLSIVYLQMASYFGRDNVSLPGFAQYFLTNSIEEYSHARKLMNYLTMRGGRTQLSQAIEPRSEYNHAEKGDALFAVEVNLSLEKLNLEKLLVLHKIAENHNDVSLADYLEGEFIQEQVEDIRTVARYVSELRRVGKGLGVFQFDRELAQRIKPTDITLPVGSIFPSVEGAGEAMDPHNVSL